MRFYGYKKCDGCRKAIKWLEAEGVEHTFVDITQQPPTKAELKKALSAGYKLGDLFNRTGGQYRELNMKYKLPLMSEDEAIELLASNGYLVKRPFAIKGSVVTVGFKPEVYAGKWG